MEDNSPLFSFGVLLGAVVLIGGSLIGIDYKLEKDEEEAKKHFDKIEESYLLEKIHFGENERFLGFRDITIETNEQTFVISTSNDYAFKKTDKESYLKKITYDYLDENYFDDIEYIFYLDSEDLKQVSKDYAFTFGNTLEVE